MDINFDKVYYEPCPFGIFHNGDKIAPIGAKIEVINFN